MITLGYIDKLNSANSNLVSVRLPIFEKAGINEKAIFEANVGYTPGNLNGYKVGDCVVVGFIDNTMNSPIILGKLYTGDETSATNFSNANSLRVSESADLPGNTVIGGVPFIDMLTKLNGLPDIKKSMQDVANSASATAEQNQLGLSMRIKDSKDAFGNLRTTLRINLHGLTKDDVGSKICLLRTTRRQHSKRSRGYKHPANLELVSSSGDVGFGYATVAGLTNKDYSGDTWDNPAIPSWMGNGLVRTEWAVSEGAINRGYIEIDISSEWVPLLYYSHYYKKWCQILGSSQYGSGAHTGCMRIKFGLIKEGTMRCISPDTLLFGVNASTMPTSKTDIYMVEGDSTTILNRQYLYMKIE